MLCFLASKVALIRLEFYFATFEPVVIFKRFGKETLFFDFCVYKFKLVLFGTLINHFFFDAAFVVPFFAFKISAKVKSLASVQEC
jgi:hypothetical protein